MLTQLPPGGQVGVVSFSRTAQALTAPTEDRTLVDNALDSLKVSGGTAVGDAIVESLRIAGDPGDESDGKPSTAIVLLSDGSSTEGKVGPLAAAKQAKDKGIPVYTVSLGTAAGTVVDPGTGKTIPVPPDPAALKKIAEASGGQGYAAADADQLFAIYENIGKKVGYVQTEEDLSVIFIGSALLLTLLASAGSLRWFRQLA
jgi:Ca-activated chloride channel family protein